MLSPGVGVVINNKYVLEAPLARGGMGSVWTATHRELGVRVAVKFMAAELALSADSDRRFEREAKAAAHLESRHIVQIRDYGVTDGTPYLVMELLKGESLDQRLTKSRRLSLPDALAILQQLAKGLRRAHDAGIIHRDLKPGNIFIARVDDEDVVKILDFGIAKLARAAGDAHATRTGVLMGSVHYASPEQLRSSKDADERSDVWSVGVILFRMIVGDLPFKGTEIADIIVKVCAEPIPRPTSLSPDLPPELDTLFTRALSRNAAERFQTITELVDAFAALVDRVANVSSGGLAEVQPRPPELPVVVPAGKPLEPPTVPLGSADSEARTMPWVPQSLASAPLSVDTTLRGSGASSTTAPPFPRPAGSPRRSAVAGMLAVVLVCTGVIVATVAILRPGSGDTTGASRPALTESSTSTPGAREVIAALSATDPLVTGTASALPAPAPLPVSASAPASSDPIQPGSPTAIPTRTTTLGRSRPAPSSSSKQPPAPRDDKDVDMP